MTTYLVDYENIHDLSVITDASEGDVISVLYTNSPKIDIRQLEAFQRANVTVNFMEVAKDEKQALDFQLDVYLGYLIGTNESDDYVIVSNDSGYLSAIEFAERLGASVSLLSVATDLSESEPLANIANKADKSKQQEELRLQLRNYTQNKNAKSISSAMINGAAKSRIIDDITARYSGDIKRRDALLRVVKNFYALT